MSGFCWLQVGVRGVHLTGGQKQHCHTMAFEYTEHFMAAAAAVVW
jgi:hypothetical protein